MAAMMDTDEDAELALLGSEEDDEQTLRRFLDALPRDATKRDAAVAAFLADTCPPAKLLLPAALWAVDGPRCARDALRAVSATKSGAQLISKEHALLFRGFAHGAPAVRKETCATVEALALNGTSSEFCAAAAFHLGKAAVDDDAGVAEAGANAARAIAKAGFVDEAIAAVDEATRAARGSLELVRACDVACGVAVALGDAAWDPRLIASTCKIACVGAAEDPLLRLAALELLQGLSKSRRAVQLICGSYLAQLIDVAESDDGYGCDQQALRAASRVLAAADTDAFARAAQDGCVARFLDLAFARLERGGDADGAEDYVCACVALGGWLESSADAADAVLKNTVLVDAWLAPPPAPKRCQAARLKSLTQAMSSKVWAELVKRGADQSLAKAIRDGDDDVRFAAWACCTAAILKSPDALVRLLSHAGVYEFLVSGPPPDDAIEAKRIKHAFVCAVAERSGGMDDSARRAVAAAAAAGPFRRAPGTVAPEVALASR